MTAPPRLSIDPSQVRTILPTADVGGVAYSPCYVAVKDPPVPGLHELLYTQGGTFPREIPDDDPRGGMSDPTKAWWRPPGEMAWRPRIIGRFPHFGWSAGITGVRPTNIVADNAVHPWMLDQEFMKRHPECWIGSFGAPCVYQGQSGLLHLWRPATVGDPAMTTKRMFAIFHYVSPNGLDWTLVHYQRRHPNVAVQAAALWCGKFTGAREYPNERGLTSVWAMPEPTLNNNVHSVSMFVQCWFGGDGPDDKVQKNVIIKMADHFGRIWSGNAGINREWDPIDNGQIPDWCYLAEQKPLEDRWTVGNPHAQIIEQFRETPAPLGKCGRYMLIAVAGDGQAVQVAFTNDLIHTVEFDGKVNWQEIEGTRALGTTMGTPRIDVDATGTMLRFWSPSKDGGSFGAARVVEVPLKVEIG